MENVNRRGYLHENYRLFHSSDRRDMDFLTHCHDFHVVLLCLNGHVTYIMEGKTYRLRAWDMLIIPEHQIHRSFFDESETYERMILWINDSYLQTFSDPILRDVFRWPLERRGGFCRPDAADRAAIIEKLIALEQAQKSDAAGHALLADSYFIQFLLCLHAVLSRQSAQETDSVTSDPWMDRLLNHINHNLSEDMRIDALAGRLFVSPSYLMHRFKQYTGCSVHQYVLQKRLIRSHGAIEGGAPVLLAAQQAGFADYSAFLRAFKKMFGCLPSDIQPK